MSDIVERLRGLRFVHVPVASQLMEEAAREIERLRLTDAELNETKVEIERLRLTKKERKAVVFAADRFGAFKNQAATLIAMLERMK